MFQGSHCDQHGCPRDYQFERMQAAMSGEDRQHGAFDEPDKPEGKPTEQKPPVVLNMDELF